VVCVQFQSEASPPTEWYSGEYLPSEFNKRLFSTGASDISMTNYYKSNSYNTFWPDGYTYPNWITLPQTASWYKDSGSWKQIIIDAMDGIRTINSSFDFTQYATSGDMDMILVWAGRTMNWSEFYWPHRSTAYVNRYGVRVKNYNAVNEKNSDGSENTAISVFCHEYGHMTGSPDLYDYSSFQLTPIGYYCIMGTSNYKTNFCGYLKWRVYGWVTPEEVFSSETYSVDALGFVASVSNPRLYKINIESPDEYLLLENRNNGADSNYENLIGRSSGLLITHIDENYPAAQGMPDYAFYGVEAIVPGLDPLITTLEEYAAYYGEMVFGLDHGYTSLGPASPDDKAPGDYLTLTSGDDTEHVIYRNTQGHTSSSGIDISDIGSSGQTMSFTVTVSPTTPAISGLVKTPGDQGIAGVTMTFSDGGVSTTTTDAEGHYVKSVSSGWSGTVTPAKTGYIFDPSSRTYPSVTSSQIDQDYFASTSFVKGSVTNSIGAGNYISEWYNNQDSSGTGDSVSVTAGSTTTIDAELAAVLPLISGAVKDSLSTGIEGVTITFSSGGGTATTDSSGSYSRNVSDGWSGVATPAKAGYTFSPTSIDYTNVTSDKPNENYEATMLTYTISGNVSTSDAAGSMRIQAAGLIDVVMDGLPGDPKTDASGNYSATADYGFSGTVTPTKAGYSFSPSSMPYTNVTSDKLDQNYIASIIQHTLTIVVGSGGGGTTNPTAGSYTHNYGTQASVTATPDSEYQFSGWTGDVPLGHEDDNPVTITMDSDKTITASFSSTHTGGNGDGGDSGGGGGCFIATAAYGSPLHPHLDILRDFRDKYLMPNGFGLKLVELYYRYSPSIAGFIAEHKLLKAAVRVNLLPVIAFSSLVVHFGPAATAVVLIFMLVFPILFMRFYPGKVRIL